MRDIINLVISFLPNLLCKAFLFCQKKYIQHLREEDIYYFVSKK